MIKKLGFIFILLITLCACTQDTRKSFIVTEISAEHIEYKTVTFKNGLAVPFVIDIPYDTDVVVGQRYRLVFVHEPILEEQKQPCE